METYKGVVTKNDLSGGFWELLADDGEKYQIRGGDQGLHVEGKRVAITGSIDRGAMGIGMTGAYLDVDSWEPA